MKKCLRISVTLAFAFIFVGASFANQPFPDTGQTKCYEDEQEIDYPAPDEPFYGAG